MSSLKDFAKSYEPKNKICIDCGKCLKYFTSRCRKCWKENYKYNHNLGNTKGNKNVNWKGNKVQYDALHDWVRRWKPKPNFCEICKKNKPKQVANISNKYKRDLSDYQWLCVKCHLIKDGTINNLVPNNRLIKRRSQT